MDNRDLEKALADGQAALGLQSWKLDSAFFMLSHLNVFAGPESTMSIWRKRVFVWLTHVSASPQWTVKLPPRRTAEISTRIVI